MSNVTVYHGSPKELVTITVTVDGEVVTNDYQVCILPLGESPTEASPEWQAPDTAGDASGIFVGPGTDNTFPAASYAQPWFWLQSTPESIIQATDTVVEFL